MYLTDYVDGMAELNFRPGELAFLDDIEPGFSYFSLFCKGQRYGFVAMRQMPAGLEVHLVVKRFSPQRLKKLRSQLEQLKRWCRHNRIDEICTFKLPGGHDPKWQRFVRLLGFEPPQVMYVTQQAVEA